MSEAGLPHGVIYEDGTGHEEYRQYSGGSNAQSSLIQFFDIVLGIEHRPTGEKKDPVSNSEMDTPLPPPKNNFLLEMRKYMPGPHRRFLEDLTKVANIREYVEAHKDNVQLTIAYDSCLAMLRAMRDKHISIVSRYVIIKSRESRSIERSRSPEVQRRRKMDIASASTKSGRDGESEKALKGTGGTTLVSFLKQARDETSENAVNFWAKKAMTRKISSRTLDTELAVKSRESDKAAPEVVNGLAGTWIDWTVDDNAGGICHY
jgi:indoleamine 2,3-dioxygenase